MRQLKTFMRNRKKEMLACGPCECRTLQCWRYANENCGCGGGATQIEVNPYPDLDNAVQFTMPWTNTTWVAAIMPGIWGGEDVILVVDADNINSNKPAWLIYVKDASSYDTFNNMWAFVTYDEDKYTLLTDAIGVGQGEISSEASSLIINDYNKYAKATIIAKLEQYNWANYFWLYDYRTNKKLWNFSFDDAALIDFDTQKLYAQLRKEKYVDWVDAMHIEEVGDTSIVVYQLSEVLREWLSLKASDMIDFYVDWILWDENWRAIATNDAAYYAVNLNSKLAMTGEDIVLRSGIREIRDNFEYYIFPIWDEDFNYIEINKNPDKGTFSVDGEWLRKNSPLIKVLEWLSREVIDNSFYHCDGGFSFVDGAMLIFQNVDNNPTEENIQSAITELNKFQRLSYCTR